MKKSNKKLASIKKKIVKNFGLFLNDKDNKEIDDFLRSLEEYSKIKQDADFGKIKEVAELRLFELCKMNLIQKIDEGDVSALKLYFEIMKTVGGFDLEDFRTFSNALNSSIINDIPVLKWIKSGDNE